MDPTQLREFVVPCNLLQGIEAIDEGKKVKVSEILEMRTERNVQRISCQSDSNKIKE